MSNKTILKFTVFADFHYKEGMYLSPVSDIEKIVNSANENGVDFILHAGDYCNDYIGSPEAINPLLNNKYGISVYGVYGNHELESNGNTMGFVTPLLTNDKEVIWGTNNGKIGDGSVGYYYFDKGDFRIICLDTNYSFNEEKGEWQHNLTASWGAPEGNIKPNSLGPEQLLWLEKLLKKSIAEAKKCIVVSHATFNSEWHGCAPDTNEVLGLFEEVNKAKKGTVFMAINGHYHTNKIAKKDGILFFDVNTVRNGRWVYNAPEHYNENHTFEYEKYDDEGNKISSEIAPLCALWQSGNTWYFDAPLFAIVTVSEDAEIEIKGTKCDWIYGVVPENLPECKVPEISNYQE